MPNADVVGFYMALGVDLPGRAKNVLVRCPFNADAHSHGDKNKSCSISREHGAFKCRGCDAQGGPYDAAILLGHSKRDTMELLRRFGLREDKRPARAPQRRSQPKQRLSVVEDQPESPPSREPLRASEEDVAKWREALAANPTVLGRLAELRGWAAGAISELGLGWDGERVVIPVRDRETTLVGICRYQPDPALRDAQNGRPKIKADQHSQRELFPAPELYSANGPLLLLEGETCVPAARTLGLPAVGYPGLGGWKTEWSERFAGRSVCLIPDASAKGRAKARDVAHDLYAHVDEVRVLDLYERERDDDADLTDWLFSGGAFDSATSREAAARALRDMAGRAPRLARGATGARQQASLLDVIQTYRRWLWLPDTRPLLATLGAAAGNYLDGDPVWLLLVGASGSGKTQIVEPLRRLPAVHSLATVTVAGLLSGSGKKDQAEGATGGVLREMGGFGMIMFKDFTSVLAMDFGARDQVLSALREIYDGHYTRPLGTDGGRKLYWPSKEGAKGKVGVIGGVTDAIDDKQAVSSAMGERLLLFRLARQDPLQMALAALDQGTENQRRDEELEEAVAGLFAYGPPRDPDLPTPEEKIQLASLATLCAHCRSGVQRDRLSREVENVNEPEMPTRLARGLQQLLLGLSSIGVGRQQAFSIVSKVAIDSVPGIRSAVLAELLKAGDASMTTSTVAGALKRTDAKAVRRALEDLELHGVIEGLHGGQGVATEWRTREWIRPFAQLTQTYGSEKGTSQETLMKAIRSAEAPTNPLEQAIAGALGSVWTDTFPASLERKGSGADTENASSPTFINPTPSIKEDAGKAQLSPGEPHGSTRFLVAEGDAGGFPGVSSTAADATPEAFIEHDGWKLSDDDLVAALEGRYGIAEEDSYPLLDLAYGVRQERGS